MDYLWFDGCIPSTLDGAETLKLLREWQADMIINHRLGEPIDIRICKQTINPPSDDVDREACFALNENWGWRTPNQKSSPTLLIKWKTGHFCPFFAKNDLVEDRSK